MHMILKSFLSLSVAASLIASASAATIGAGVATLSLPSPNNQVDTPTDGTNDQSRQNLDISFTSTLNAGVHQAIEWTFRAGQTGSVIPYLAFQTGGAPVPGTDANRTFQILAVGNQVDVSGADLDIDMTLPFGGSDVFTLPADTTVFAGIVNPTIIGSQNPIYTNLNSGSFMDHDNNGWSSIRTYLANSCMGHGQ